MNSRRSTYKKKRVVFRLIGNERVGMGHIYRALSIAQEIKDQDILFVCNTGSKDAVEKLLQGKYSFTDYPEHVIVRKIIEMEPDLVVNDILDTNLDDVVPLREIGVGVVNFEDLGEGATKSNLTINELYDRPQLSGDNERWGHQYFFVRDEFRDVKPNEFSNRVSEILLTFGGTDQHNLSAKIYSAIAELCVKHRVYIHIVTGPGYGQFDTLRTKIKSITGVSVTHDTGVISRIMENCQIGITSNGRTVYELAHMNIPSIVIPQHGREKTHSFASTATGCVPLPVYQPGYTEKIVCDKLEPLLLDSHYRKQLYEKMTSFSFLRNKKKVIDEILSVISTK